MKNVINFQQINIEEFCSNEDFCLTKNWLEIEFSKDNNCATFLISAIKEFF